jgi:hypothetical protein
MAFPKFTEGPAKRPDIHHDHGFLDDGKGNIDPSKRESPTWRDYRSLAWWTTKLDGAQVIRRDLHNATDAYAHFLDGTGTDLNVDYEGFLTNDDAGKTVLKSAIEDTRSSAIAIHDAKVKTPPTSKTEETFSITSDAIPVGGHDRVRYPYPKTENWQKAIGAHFIWMDGAVKVSSDPALKKREFEIKMTIHMEDMYNFNPGAHDIATGTPDSENGRFEVTGLAKEFLSKATVTRTIRFSVPFGPLPDTRIQPADEDVSWR